MAIDRVDHRGTAESRRDVGETPSRAPDLRVAGRPARRGRLRREDSVDAGAPRLSPSGHARRSQTLLSFYRSGKDAGRTSSSGIQFALERLLVSPNFLFRVERDPANAATGAPYRVTDLELASRLSFFLWSSIPDDELLDVAAARQAERRRGAGAAGQADARRPAVSALVTNFAASGC